MSLVLESTNNLFGQKEHPGEIYRKSTLFTSDNQHLEQLILKGQTYFIFDSPDVPSDRVITFYVQSGTVFVKNDKTVHKFKKGKTFSISYITDPVIVYTKEDESVELLLIASCPDSEKSEGYSKFFYNLMEKLRVEEPELFSYSNRVKDLCFKIGLELDLTPRELYRVRSAGQYFPLEIEISDDNVYDGDAVNNIINGTVNSIERTIVKIAESYIDLTTSNELKLGLPPKKAFKKVKSQFKSIEEINIIKTLKRCTQ